MVTFEGAVRASQQVSGSVPTAFSSITESFQQVLDSLDAARTELREGVPDLPGAKEHQPEADGASWFGRSPRETDRETTNDLLLPFASRPPLAPRHTEAEFDDASVSRTTWTPHEPIAAVAVEPLWERGTNPARTQPVYETSGGEHIPLPPPAGADPHGRAKGRGRPRLLIKSSRFTGPLGVGAVSGLIVASSMLSNGFMEAVPSWLAAQADRSSPDDGAPSPGAQRSDERTVDREGVGPGASGVKKRLLHVPHVSETETETETEADAAAEADGHYDIEVSAAAARFQN